MKTTTNTNIPNETSTWQKPGAWRKPCIVHVTMVAKGREPIFGKLTHNGKRAEVEKTSVGWALINQQQRMLELCPEIKILADKVMPNHHHIVLQVRRTMQRSIKEVVRGYMQGCRDARLKPKSWALKETCTMLRHITVCLRIKGNFRR